MGVARHGGDLRHDVLVAHPVAVRDAGKRLACGNLEFGELLACAFGVIPLGQRKACRANHVLLNPLVPGTLRGHILFDLVVPHDASLRRVHKKHLAGHETALEQHVLRRNVEHARLGGKNQAVVARERVASGAQAVAVEHGAHAHAVGERDCGRAVPRLHEARLVGVEVMAAGAERVVVVPGFRHEHAHGARQAAPVHVQELRHVVQDCRVGTFAVDDGQHPVEARNDGGVQVGFPGANPVDVAAQRVDLAVVHDVALGMRAFPGRRGVRGVARVDQGDGRLDRGVGKVQVERPELAGKQHALVHDDACAHGADIEDVLLRHAHALGALLDGAACDIEGPFELHAALNRTGSHHEGLPDARLAGLCRRTQVVRIDGHLAPEEHGEAVFRAALLYERAGLLEQILIAREEQHGDAVVALVGQKAATLLGFLAEEPVRYLEEDACSVARVRLQARAASMVHVEKHRQGVAEHLMGANALDVCQCANAACVVLELRAIQSPCLGRQGGGCVHTNLQRTCMMSVPIPLWSKRRESGQTNDILNCPLRMFRKRKCRRSLLKRNNGVR